MERPRAATWPEPSLKGGDSGGAISAATAGHRASAQPGPGGGGGSMISVPSAGCEAAAWLEPVSGSGEGPSSGTELCSPLPTLSTLMNYLCLPFSSMN